MLDFRYRITWLPTRLARESGQTMSEYSIALLLIILVTVTLFTSLGGGVANAVTNVARLLP